MNLLQTLRDFELRTRPVDPVSAAALAERWDTLPDGVKTPGQVLGRRTTGCEGTHGVFPKCDFACKPCYHSSDANKVRVDGPHTLEEVTRQMNFFRDKTGRANHAQLIGGEVSLLEPNDHAAALEAIRNAGRTPMSFTHGDFNYDYLRSLAIDASGKPRFKTLSFACHIDSTMVGRDGAKKPTGEAELNDHRAAFCAMFDRLRDEHGVRSRLAHNMTVTPDNVDQIADVVRDCRDQGWAMFSFQPAAYIGNESRWQGQYREITSEYVWKQIEEGAGSRLPYKALHVGDTRCNRSTWGAVVDGSYTPLLDDEDPQDRAFAAKALETFPGNFIAEDPSIAVLRILRAVAASPSILPATATWAKRFFERAGGISTARHGIRPLTFVMHQFIDAKDSAAAWEHIQLGTRAHDKRILAAQERLEACAYVMAHPDKDEIVPACVQHAVYDIDENRELSQLLPLPTTRSAATR